MSGNEDIGKMLGPWIGKAKQLAEPPLQNETRDSLKRSELVRRDGGGEDELTQLNFKIPMSTKKRVKQLALRDNITLLVMLDRMLELYEKEYGRLGAK